MQKSYRSHDILYLITFFFLLLLLFSIFRALFYFIYNPEFINSSAIEIIRGFMYGVRFDLAVASWVTIPIFVLTLIPIMNRFKWYRIFWYVTSSTIFVVIFLMLFSDILYFKHAHKRLGYEAFAYLNSSFVPVAKTFLSESPILILLLFIVLAGIVFSVLKLYKIFKLSESNSKSTKQYIISIVIVLPLLVILGRGGLQRVPLRAGDSFISHDNSVNILTINSPFLAIRSLGKSNSVRVMDSDNAQEICLDQLHINSSQQIDSHYPILTKGNTTTEDKIEPYNIIIILIESFTAKFTESGGDTLGVTPCFNRLSKDGLLFNNFFATGFRSTSGLFSVLTGIPDMPGVPIMRRQELQNNFGSLTVLLKEQGYKNIFVTGGRLDFDNLNNMLIHEKFDLIIGKEQLNNCGGPERTWGYDDEYSYKRLNLELSQTKTQPFFSYMITVSSHAPYQLPDEKHIKFSQNDHPEYEFLNSLYYADWALGDYIEKASKEEYFNNSIFIITADHTHHNNLNIFENQNIPLLIYAPGIIKPGIDCTVSSQVDILPTVTNLIKLPYQASMGRDLLDNIDDAGFAFWITGQGIGWVEDDFISVMGLGNDIPIVYNYKLNDFSTNVAEENYDLGSKIRKKANAYYQFANDLLLNNNIFPSNTDNLTIDNHIEENYEK